MVYPDLEQVLVPFVGRPYREKRVQGVGGPGITEIAGPLATVVAKHNLTLAEQHFYQRYRSQVVRYGVDAPRLLASGHFADDAWVVLEFVPPLLEKFRWSERPDVLTILAHLHHIAGESRFIDPHDLYAFHWPDTLTADALQYFPKTVVPSLRERITACQAMAHQVLFQPMALIHGDPNPTNWGIRPSGQPVLFDWSRYGYGHPAIDLAITIPGLPHLPETQRIAQAYLERTPDAQTASQLARTIGLAKIWSAVEFLSMGHREKLSSAAGRGIAMLTADFPKWIAYWHRVLVTE